MLLEATRELSMGGIVAKRVDASYRPGTQSSAWVKAKHHRHTAMTMVDVRRRGGRLTAVLVDGGEGLVWIKGGGLPREDDAGMFGMVVTVRHPLTPARGQDRGHGGGVTRQVLEEIAHLGCDVGGRSLGEALRVSDFPAAPLGQSEARA